MIELNIDHRITTHFMQGFTGGIAPSEFKNLCTSINDSEIGDIYSFDGEEIPRIVDLFITFRKPHHLTHMVRHSSISELYDRYVEDEGCITEERFEELFVKAQAHYYRIAVNYLCKITRNQDQSFTSELYNGCLQ